MLQMKKSEMTLINKISHCIFQKATIASLTVLTDDLKYMSVTKKSLAFFCTNKNSIWFVMIPEESYAFFFLRTVLVNVHYDV